MTYTTTIIGLGNIGMLYDQEHSTGGGILSHARAFASHEDFELVSAVDTSAARREIFTEVYRAPTHASVEVSLLQTLPDVVVVSAPTPEHLSIVESVLTLHRPQAILCEKPLADRVDDAQQLCRLARERSVELYVNFIRRADSAVKTVRDRIRAKEFEVPFKATVRYSKGLLHNGSHFLDLLSFWFGSVRWSESVETSPLRDNLGGQAVARFGFDTGEALFYEVHEDETVPCVVEINAANVRISLCKDGTIYWQRFKVDKYTGEPNIGQGESDRIDGNMVRYQYNVAAELGLALKGEQHTLCSGAAALENQRWIDKVCAHPSSC